MWLLLIPVAVVLALVLAAVLAAALILFGAGTLIFAVAREVPWLLIAAGVWLLVKSGCGRKSRRPARAVTPLPVPTAAPRPVRQDPPRSVPEAKPPRELPIDVRVKVEQIRHKADVLLSYAERFPPFSQDLYIVRQTAADYLPRTIDAYLALPGDDDPVVAATGKTALQELREQLALLDSRLDDVAQDLQREDIDRLLANRRFLEERFLRERDRLDESDGAGAGARPGEARAAAESGG